MVDGWRVDPSGVEGVLNSVTAKAEQISSALGGTEDGSVAGVDTIVQDAATAAQSQVIGESIIGFFEHQKPVLSGITDRIRASLMGASGATQAVIDGDDDMAGKTQAMAVAAASSGDFTALESQP
ncbi:DUF6507 family protein [Curtobacterium sp. Leaf261]|uniref:DUF6507 family protein n=1 Tax=Curtobacterium sp. Leaf261 TaxID=1736311 RepID=UPI0007012337|nr:DUF6507 family protein [Curtobacterium sp. Leaf261]KQO62214.1 hypothetical protein ASF23_10355 [Curtobacterium sp. Leaf261]